MWASSVFSWAFGSCLKLRSTTTVECLICFHVMRLIRYVLDGFGLVVFSCFAGFFAFLIDSWEIGDRRWQNQCRHLSYRLVRRRMELA